MLNGVQTLDRALHGPLWLRQPLLPHRQQRCRWHCSPRPQVACRIACFVRSQGLKMAGFTGFEGAKRRKDIGGTLGGFCTGICSGTGHRAIGASEKHREPAVQRGPCEEGVARSREVAPGGRIVARASRRCKGRLYCAQPLPRPRLARTPSRSSRFTQSSPSVSACGGLM